MLHCKLSESRGPQTEAYGMPIHGASSPTGIHSPEYTQPMIYCESIDSVFLMQVNDLHAKNPLVTVLILVMLQCNIAVGIQGFCYIHVSVTG